MVEAHCAVINEINTPAGAGVAQSLLLLPLWTERPAAARPMDLHAGPDVVPEAVAADVAEAVAADVAADVGEGPVDVGLPDRPLLPGLFDRPLLPGLLGRGCVCEWSRWEVARKHAGRPYCICLAKLLGYCDAERLKPSY